MPLSSWQRKETALPEESAPVNEKVALTLFVGFTGVDVILADGGVVLIVHANEAGVDRRPAESTATTLKL